MLSLFEFLVTARHDEPLNKPIFHGLIASGGIINDFHLEELVTHTNMPYKSLSKVRQLFHGLKFSWEKPLVLTNLARLEISCKSMIVLTQFASAAIHHNSFSRSYQDELQIPLNCPRFHKHSRWPCASTQAKPHREICNMRRQRRIGQRPNQLSVSARIPRQCGHGMYRH
jgi:hypothetical protein